jgi:hypothetical protein
MGQGFNKMNGNAYYATGNAKLKAERHYVGGESENIRRRYVVDHQSTFPGGSQTLRKPVTIESEDDNIR